MPVFYVSGVDVAAGPFERGEKLPRWGVEIKAESAEAALAEFGIIAEEKATSFFDIEVEETIEGERRSLGVVR